jgi:hypothetical protein
MVFESNIKYPWPGSVRPKGNIGCSNQLQIKKIARPRAIFTQPSPAFAGALRAGRPKGASAVVPTLYEVGTMADKPEGIHEKTWISKKMI